MANRSSGSRKSSGRSRSRAAARAQTTSVDTPADFTTDEVGGPGFAGVDVADIGDDRLDGENEPVIVAGESWVILGDHDDVPERFVGSPAAVVTAPVLTKQDEDTGATYQVNPENAVYEVRERSQGVTFFLPKEAFARISHSGGRTGVVNFP